MLDFLKNIGPTELIILVIILIVLFGAKAIAGLGKKSGETVKEVKKMKREFTEYIEADDKEPGKK